MHSTQVIKTPTLMERFPRTPAFSFCFTELMVGSRQRRESFSHLPGWALSKTRLSGLQVSLLPVCLPCYCDPSGKGKHNHSRGSLNPIKPKVGEHNSCHFSQEMLINDFHELRTAVKRMGLLKPRHSFFAFIFLHAFLLDIAAWLTIWYFGKSWVPFLIGVAMFTTGQIQYAYFQHDLGHLSVFQKPKWNRFCQFTLVAVLKGGPPTAWNHLHNQHHAKPNCFRKDPDLNMHPVLFSLGKALSIELGKKKKKYMPYQHQHKYFAFLAPLAFALYVQFMIFYYAFQRKKWLELFFILFYMVRACLMYVPIMGFKSFMALYWLSRFLESSWFLWVSQMNHIPMHINYDQNLDWVSAQLAATCNVDQSWFNDWYTGHLNFQIEHHLFPTMPRHNYWKVAPLVKSLCVKHGVKYQCKPMLTAFADILRSLKESGEHWQDAYFH